MESSAKLYITWFGFHVQTFPAFRRGSNGYEEGLVEADEEGKERDDKEGALGERPSAQGLPTLREIDSDKAFDRERDDVPGGSESKHVRRVGVRLAHAGYANHVVAPPTRPSRESAPEPVEQDVGEQDARVGDGEAGEVGAGGHVDHTLGKEHAEWDEVPDHPYHDDERCDVGVQILTLVENVRGVVVEQVERGWRVGGRGEQAAALVWTRQVLQLFQLARIGTWIVEDRQDQLMQTARVTLENNQYRQFNSCIILPNLIRSHLPFRSPTSAPSDPSRCRSSFAISVQVIISDQILFNSPCLFSCLFFTSPVFILRFNDIVQGFLIPWTSQLFDITAIAWCRLKFGQLDPRKTAKDPRYPCNH